jgi:hypothetical protein
MNLFKQHLPHPNPQSKPHPLKKTESEQQQPEPEQQQPERQQPEPAQQLESESTPEPEQQQEQIDNNVCKRSIYGVYFIGCIGRYLDIVPEQMQCLFESGLYHETKTIFIFISAFSNDNYELKNIIEEYDPDKKCVLITSDENLYEKFAINNYKAYIETSLQSQPEGITPYYVYYFHSKAVTRDKYSVFDNRRKILNHYTLNLYRLNLELLEQYDAVGCSLTNQPLLHFSGNFWWTKSEHVAKLPPCGNEYLAPEMYICRTANGKYISLSQHTNNADIHGNISRSESIIRQELTNVPL